MEGNGRNLNPWITRLRVTCLQQFKSIYYDWYLNLWFIFSVLFGFFINSKCWRFVLEEPSQKLIGPPRTSTSYTTGLARRRYVRIQTDVAGKLPICCSDRCHSQAHETRAHAPPSRSPITTPIPPFNSPVSSLSFLGDSCLIQSINP
jgi:hypothetical protein